MTRKWFHTHRCFKGIGHINVIPGYKKSNGGSYINLYLTDEEADIIRNINITHDYGKRTMYIERDHMMHEIYKVLPELFEY